MRTVKDIVVMLPRHPQPIFIDIFSGNQSVLLSFKQLSHIINFAYIHTYKLKESKLELIIMKILEKQ